MSEVVARAEIQAERLRDYLEVFTPIVDEGRIHFNDGLTVRVVDPANVAMYHPCTLGRAAFEGFDTPGSVTIGTNFNRIIERISTAGATDVVSLTVDMETRKLHIEYGRVDTTVTLIDPETIRQEPSRKDLDFHNEFTVTGADMDEALKVADMVSDHVSLCTDPDDRTVSVYAEGDDDDATLTFEGDDIIACDVQTKASSLVSLDYLKDLFKPVPDDAEVTMHVNDEFPVTIQWESHDGTLVADALIAPRIQTS